MRWPLVSQVLLTLCIVGLVAYGSWSEVCIFIAPDAQVAAGSARDWGRTEVLFTFASLVVALFGIVSFFQNGEALRKLVSVEQELLWSKRELLVGRMHSRFLAQLCSTRIVDGRSVGLLMAHCYRIADTLDSDDRAESYWDEVAVSIYELFKLGGRPYLQGIVEEMRCTAPLRHGYTRMCDEIEDFLLRMPSR